MATSNILYNVMTEESEGRLINLRLPATLREEFKIAVRLLGFKSMSGALFQFIVRTVNEQKERHPQAFAKVPIREEQIDGRAALGDYRPPTSDVHYLKESESGKKSGEKIRKRG